jgi:anti-anti-sigma factor
VTESGAEGVRLALTRPIITSSSSATLPFKSPSSVSPGSYDNRRLSNSNPAICAEGYAGVPALNYCRLQRLHLRIDNAAVELFTLEQADEPGFFRLVGELDMANTDAVQARLQEELERSGALTLDTTDLTFMDSQGLRMLIQLGEQAQKQGSTIKVANCTKQLRRLLQMAVPQGIPGVEVIQLAR